MKRNTQHCWVFLFDSSTLSSSSPLSSPLVARFALPDDVSFVRSEQQRFWTSVVCKHSSLPGYLANFTRTNRYGTNSRYNSSNWPVSGSADACTEDWFYALVDRLSGRERKPFGGLLFFFFLSFFLNTHVARRGDRCYRKRSGYSSILGKHVKHDEKQYQGNLNGMFFSRKFYLPRSCSQRYFQRSSEI